MVNLKEDLLKIFRNIIFIPFCQADFDQSDIELNCSSLDAILNSNYSFFLSVISNEKSLKPFLDSYFMFRHREYHENIENLELNELDRKIIFFYFRLLSLVEFQDLFSQLPKPRIEIVGKSSNQSNKEEILKSQARQLILECEFLKFPYILDIISIIGKSNFDISQKIYLYCKNLNENFVDDMQFSILESSKVLDQISKSINLIKEIKNDDKDKLTETKIYSIKSEYLRVNELALFSLDILFSLYSLFSAIFSHKSYIADIEFFSSDDQSRFFLTPHLGIVVVESLIDFYEFTIPIFESLSNFLNQVIGNEKLSENNSFKDLNIQKVLLQARSISLSLLDEIFESYICFSKIKALSLDSCKSNSSFAIGDNFKTWLDILNDQSQLISENPSKGQDETREYGSFFSDYINFHGNEKLRTSLVLSGIDDEEIIDHVLWSIKDGLNPDHMAKNLVDNKNEADRTIDFSQHLIQSEDEKIESIQAIFPELGEGFIEACFQIYSCQEELIEALLSNNLDPRLSRIDKRTSKIVFGKKDLEKELNNDKKFKGILKEKIRMIERQQELDYQLIDQEYDDDYDDQYDDALPDNLAEKSSSTKNKKNISIDWDKKMVEMKRLNNLIKEEEAEIKFWHDMKINNRDKYNHNENLSTDSEESDPNNIHRQQLISQKGPTKKPTQPSLGKDEKFSKKPNNSHRPKPSNQENELTKSKSRTKKFDKHHQKDRALKKFSKI